MAIAYCLVLGLILKWYVFHPAESWFLGHLIATVGFSLIVLGRMIASGGFDPRQFLDVRIQILHGVNRASSPFGLILFGYLALFLTFWIPESHFHR